MKWIFLLGLLIGTIALAAFLRAKPRYLVHTCFGIGVAMFLLVPSLWAAPISWAGWPGPVQGVQVTLLDGASLALIYATRRAPIPWWIKSAFGVLCLAVLVSTIAAYQAMPAIFYAWQLFSAALFFVAIVRVCATVPQAPLALVAGLGTALIYEAGYATYQFFSGVTKPGGSLGHANFLGLSSHFVVLPALALLLSGRVRSFWPTAVVLAGLTIAVVGGSRATLGLFGIGVALTFFLSLQRQITSRKMRLAGTAALLLLFSAPIIMWGTERRTEEQKISSNAERNAMNLAARMIIADHPLGVGANQYVIIANTAGYSQRAGVAWNFGSRSASVHNTYYLVTAEMGFLGLIGLVLLLASFIVLGIRLLGRSGDDSVELVPGLLATMLVVAVHLAYEWVFMHFVIHYLFAVSAGILVGIAARTRSGAKRSASVPVSISVPSPAS